MVSSKVVVPVIVVVGFRPLVELGFAIAMLEDLIDVVSGSSKKA